MTNFSAVLKANRILIQAELRPLQGTRFQPTGFPNLGAAEYRNAKGESMLLVESNQSIANRLESTIWNPVTEDVIDIFHGLPYVSTVVGDKATDTLREAHRLNSPYIIEEMKVRLRKHMGMKEVSNKDTGKKGSEGIDIRKLAAAVFNFDPNSILHGVFLEKITGSARLARVVSGFIEAEQVLPVESGGVKNDRIDASTGEGSTGGIEGARKGFGNVPFSRTEYTAAKIIAYFNVDVILLRSYGLGGDAEQLLIATALWKIRQFLENGGRLRTSCDLEVVPNTLIVTRPTDFPLPSIDELEAIIRAKIETCTRNNLFASPAKTIVQFSGAK